LFPRYFPSPFLSFCTLTYGSHSRAPSPFSHKQPELKPSPSSAPPCSACVQHASPANLAPINSRARPLLAPTAATPHPPCESLSPVYCSHALLLASSHVRRRCRSATQQPRTFASRFSLDRPSRMTLLSCLGSRTAHRRGHLHPLPRMGKKGPSPLLSPSPSRIAPAAYSQPPHASPPTDRSHPPSCTVQASSS
jgi:hypothetical protein